MDIQFRLPNGSRYRKRCRAPVDTRSGAMRWGQDRERHLLQHGPEQKKKEAPTLKEFAPKFLENYAKADRHKPSGIASKESILRIHLVPVLGGQKLDAITNAKVQPLKLHLHDKSPKTVNNVPATLSVLLKTAVEWELIKQLPCAIRLLPVERQDAAFHDFDGYVRRSKQRARVTGVLRSSGVALVSEPKVPGRERPARSGLQVLLKAHRLFLGRELQAHHYRPRSTRRRVAAWSMVVPFQPRTGITRDPHIVTRRVHVAADDVDEPLFDAVHPGEDAIQAPS